MQLNANKLLLGLYRKQDRPKIQTLFPWPVAATGCITRKIVCNPAKPEMIGFLSYYVHVTKYLPDTRYQQNANRKVQRKKVLRIMTPCDVYTMRYDSHYAAELDMYEEMPQPKTNRVLQFKKLLHLEIKCLQYNGTGCGTN